MFSQIKKAMNLGEEFGAGNFLLNYPKVPANIALRGGAYSPFGFIKSIMDVGKGILGHGFDQRNFVNSTARATLGTSIIGAGYYLSKMGLVRLTSPKNANVRAIEETQGLNQSQM
jgi:hypothetical protein